LNIFNKLKQGIAKTSKNISDRLGDLLSFFTDTDDFYEVLEETLILADLGPKTSMDIVSSLQKNVREKKIKTPDEIKAELTEILINTISVDDTGLNLNTKPSIILVIGVNGVGKTTSIGKLALKLSNEGKKVLLCAGDTFRAAAGEQLSIWADRVCVEIIKRDEGADPASVIYDGINAAKARDVDVIICDTAGRLHNKSNLMNELNKISRVIDRELPNADRETLLVLDATTGQNGLIQARECKGAANITGVILTKLDGTAKGGIVYSIASELGVPVKLIGVGEKADDLIEFNSRDYTLAILN
jgi:fused signal recognition particle receptor